VIKQYVSDVYAYEFDVPDCPSPWPEVSFPYGSAHTSELQFLFPQFRGGSGKVNPLTKSQQHLASQMVVYWTNFAAHSTPNGAEDGCANGTPQWQVYRSQDDNVMLLCAPEPAMIDAWGSRHNSDYWDAFY
jgi:para-nitrobenzyl esterase